MAQERDFISKVFCPYEEIQHSIRKYKEDRETLSIAFDQVLDFPHYGRHRYSLIKHSGGNDGK